MSEPIFDHDRLDVYRLAIAYNADSFGVAKMASRDSIVALAINGFVLPSRFR